MRQYKAIYIWISMFSLQYIYISQSILKKLLYSKRHTVNLSDLETPSPVQSHILVLVSWVYYNELFSYVAHY